MSKIEDLQVANTVFIDKTELKDLRFKADFLDFLYNEMHPEFLVAMKVKFMEDSRTD